MSPPDQPTAFSALGIVERLSQDELEHLTEFSDQLEFPQTTAKGGSGASRVVEDVAKSLPRTAGELLRHLCELPTRLTASFCSISLEHWRNTKEH